MLHSPHSSTAPAAVAKAARAPRAAGTGRAQAATRGRYDERRQEVGEVTVGDEPDHRASAQHRPRGGAGEGQPQPLAAPDDDDQSDHGEHDEAVAVAVSEAAGCVVSSG